VLDALKLSVESRFRLGPAIEYGGGLPTNMCPACREEILAGL